MSALPDTELIRLWETGEVRPLQEKALAFLAYTDCNIEPDHLPDITVGMRDAFLVDFYQTLFGTELDCKTTCPSCSTSLEFSVTTDEIRKSSITEIPQDGFMVVVGEYVITFRIPTYRDLLELSQDANVKTFSREIIGRCVLSAERKGDKITPNILPEEVVSALSEKITELDPMAEILFHFKCPECKHSWNSILEITEHIWLRLDLYVKRLLADIHSLASTYGWSESEILSMGRARRSVYLEMISA